MKHASKPAMWGALLSLLCLSTVVAQAAGAAPPAVPTASAAPAVAGATAKPAGSAASDTAGTPAASAASAASAAPAPKARGKLYTVVDGYKVDAETMKGFKAWRAGGCDRCHGANQEGLVGPSLVESLKTLSKEDFITTVTNGRLDKGMQRFAESPTVMGNINQLYAYLKGRSDGAITRAKVEEIKK